MSGPTTPLGPDSSVGTFPMRGKSPGDPGTPGVPDPTPKYSVLTHNDQENVYDLADENIVSPQTYPKAIHNYI